jgi:hypothetical protein
MHPDNAVVVAVKMSRNAMKGVLLQWMMKMKKKAEEVKINLPCSDN